MSAKLLKALAAGHCTVKSVSAREVVIYWKEPRGALKHQIIRPGQKINLLSLASVVQLRRSLNLKDLCNRRLLRIVPPDEDKNKLTRSGA